MKEDLIEQVAAEVLRRAAPQNEEEGILHVGGLTIDVGNYEAFRNGEKLSLTLKEFELGWSYVLSGAFDAVMIGSLSAAQLLQFPDEASAEALLLGKPVYLWEDGLDYRRHARTANRALWSRLLAAERQLRQLGVQFLSSAASPLLTAAEMRKLLAAGRVPSADCRMTPLARDILEGRA